MTDEMPSIVEFSEDVSQAEAPEPLPIGDYKGVIRAVEVKMSQRDTRYAAVTFHIGADQYPADYQDGNPEGATLIYRRVSLEDNPQARFGLRRFLEAIGAPGGKSIDVNEWVGMEATVEVGHDPYEGVMRAQITRVKES